MMMKIDPLSQTITRHARLLSFILFSIVAVLYCYIAYTSFGYDDEYYNIRVVSENNLDGLIRLVQSTDIHPPLSYILNFLFFKILHSWNAVRVVSALFFLGALLYVANKNKSKAGSLLIILLLGLNPTILLWATSLRWYAYATPILLILGILPDYRNKFYWPFFFGCFFIVFYLGYIGFILFVPYFLYYWINDHNNFKQKATRVLIWGSVFALAYARQFFVFFTVHRNSNLENNQQVFDLKTSLVSVISSCFSNQGVFPLSVWGIISIAGSAVIFVSAVLSFREANREKHWIVFALSTALFVITGIAGKIRNLVLLEPSRNLFFSSLISMRKKKILLAGLLLMVAGNTMGVYHVIIHRYTTKNAWNIPLDETLQKLKQLETPGAKEIYFSHSPTFTYYLMESGKNSISFYNSLYFDTARIRSSIRQLGLNPGMAMNFTFIITYRGKSISVEHYDEMLQAMNAVQADSTARIHIGHNRDYRLKRKFFPDYPEYEVEIVKLYGVRKDFSKLSAWEKAK